MTHTRKPFSVTHAALRVAADLLLGQPPRINPADVTVAQDTLLHALGTLERAAFTYHPSEHADPKTLARLFRQETVNETAAEAHRQLQDLIGPLVDREIPLEEDIKRLAPILRDFIPSRFPSALDAEIRQ